MNENSSTQHNEEKNKSYSTDFTSKNSEHITPQEYYDQKNKELDRFLMWSILVLSILVLVEVLAFY